MDPARIHLVFTHFPLAIMLVAVCLLAFGLIRNIPIIIKTGLILNIAAFCFTVLMYFSGEGTQEIVKDFRHIDAHSLDQHKYFAQLTWYFSLLLLIISAVSLVVSQGKWSSRLPKIALIISVVAFILFSITAHLGGRVSHPELRDSDERILNEFFSKQ